MGLNRLGQMNLLAIKSDILEFITNIGGPLGRGMKGTCPPPNFTGSTLEGGHVPPQILPDT